MLHTAYSLLSCGIISLSLLYIISEFIVSKDHILKVEKYIQSHKHNMRAWRNSMRSQKEGPKIAVQKLSITDAIVEDSLKAVSHTNRV